MARAVRLGNVRSPPACWTGPPPPTIRCRNVPGQGSTGVRIRAAGGHDERADVRAEGGDGMIPVIDTEATEIVNSGGGRG